MTFAFSDLVFQAYYDSKDVYKMVNDENNNKKSKMSSDCEKKMVDIEPLKYDCPVSHCERKYKREIALLVHILTDHRKIYNKIMEIVCDKNFVQQICNSTRDKPQTNGAVQPTVSNGTANEQQQNGMEIVRHNNVNTSNIPSTSTNIPSTSTTNIPSTSSNIPSTSANASTINQASRPTALATTSTLSATTTNILKQVKQSPYYHLQVNETLDVNNCACIFVTVRYKNKNTIQEDVLLTKTNVTNTSAADILNYIFDLITKGELCPNKWIGISLDGIRAASFPLNDIMELITQKGLDVKLTHHFTRRAEFISQHLSADLNSILDEAIQFINMQKTNNLNTICAGMDNVTKEIFLRTDRYWLSYGNVLTRLFEMRRTFSERMSDSDWICGLAYLADIFEHFDRFYQQLVVNNSSVFQIYSEYENMIDTLKMDKDQFGWHATSTSYRNLQLFLTESSIQINPSLQLGIQKSLKNVSNHLHKYLPVSESEIQTCEWIINPFKFNVYNVPKDLAENAAEYTELINLRKNLQKKFSYSYEMLELFWIEMFELYPNISRRAMQYLLTFKTAQLYELEFGKFLVADNMVS